MAGGEAVRYRTGTAAGVSGASSSLADEPMLPQEHDNPNGLPMEAFERYVAGVAGREIRNGFAKSRRRFNPRDPSHHAM